MRLTPIGQKVGKFSRIEWPVKKTRTGATVHFTFVILKAIILCVVPPGRYKAYPRKNKCQRTESSGPMSGPSYCLIIAVAIILNSLLQVADCWLQDRKTVVA